MTVQRPCSRAPACWPEPISSGCIHISKADALLVGYYNHDRGPAAELLSCTPTSIA
jgi:hypothetical protein